MGKQASGQDRYSTEQGTWEWKNRGLFIIVKCKLSSCVYAEVLENCWPQASGLELLGLLVPEGGGGGGTHPPLALRFAPP